jgi:hypothetical protein
MLSGWQEVHPMERERIERPDPPGQTWGQGEGEHESTIPEDEESTTTPSSYSEGTAGRLEDPPLARDDEGMDR